MIEPKSFSDKKNSGAVKSPLEKFLEVRGYRITCFEKKILDYKAKFRLKTNDFSLPQVSYLGTYVLGKERKNKVLSICLAVKNRQENLKSVFEKLICHIEDSSEIFVVFDNCEDSSEFEMYELVSRLSSNHPVAVAIHFLRSESDIFESTCENIAFCLSEGKYLVSMQADIYLTNDSFFRRAILSLETHEQLMAVSGRAIIRVS